MGTKFARVLTDEEKEEQKAKQEKEALLARLKREAAKAEQAAKEAKIKADQVAVVQNDIAASAPAGKVPLGGGMTKFTKVLSEEEHKARLAQGSSPTPGKKRVALTPVVQASPIAVKRANSNPLAKMVSSGAKKATITPVTSATTGKKKNPIAALSADQDLSSPSSKVASLIAVRKTPSASRNVK